MRFLDRCGIVLPLCAAVFCGIFATASAHAKINTSTKLTSSLNPSTYGQSVTFTATVTPVTGSGTPTGTVTFSNGTNQTTKTLSGGKASLSAAPGAGTYSITATYNGDSNYNGSTSNTVQQKVNQATTTTTLTSSPNPSTFNQQVTFTASISGQYGGTVAGTVVFSYGGTQMCSSSVSSGTATCLYSQLPVGTDVITAAYGGDSNDLSSSGTENQIVNPIATTTSLTSSPNPSGYLQQVTFTATVSPIPDGGTVAFFYNGTSLPCGNVNLNSGVATCADANLPVGSDSVTATYNGDTDYSGSTSAPVVQVVNPVLQSITVSPQGLSVAVNSNPQQYTAEGYYNNGTQQNITSSVTWTSSSTGTATISSAGLETPVAAGSTTITAALNSIQGTSTLTVDATGTFFVAPNGNDAWSGTLSAPNGNGDGPFASPSRAQYAVRNAAKPATVYLRAGTYYPALTPAVQNSNYSTYTGTLLFTSADSGSSISNQVTWAEYPGDISVGPAVISGGVPANTDPNSGAGLNLKWTNTGNWYKATLPQYLPGSNNTVAMEPFEGLYYKGERRLRARIHDTGTSTIGNYGTTYSAGYYMSGTGVCSAIGNWQGAEFPTNLESCNLGSFLRVEGTIAPTDPLGSYGGVQCPYATDSSGNEKCLDRFYFVQSTGTGADTIDNWTNLTALPAADVPSQPPCNTTSNFPAGDVELILFGAWTVAEMRVNCVNSTNTPYPVIYLQSSSELLVNGVSKNGNGGNYDFMGPTPGHRFIIENSYDAFMAAANPNVGQVGIWFLDRSAGAGNWVLNYIANPNANPPENPASDYIVIPQLPQTGSSFPAGGQFPLLVGSTEQNDYIGASLLSATNLEYVTFNGITFEADNFYPDSNPTSSNGYASGFNNDVNGEMPIPQAIDCENCQFVTFNGITVRHTSASGLLAGATSTNTCADNAEPTTTSFCDLIENSSFYDIGDSGIRIGHYPQGSDTTAVAQDVLVQNNRVQGFSRVLADGEGITQGNGYNNEVLNNTVTDGYHAGISICYDACGRNTKGTTTSNGDNVIVDNNLISNLMQGITSDGGSLYFNVGGSVNSATGDEIYGNVVYDTTDSYIIDVINSKTVLGSGYGGEGIYLDAQTADVDVENNLVFNVDGNAIHLTEGLVSGEKPNNFAYNIFAFGNQGMFTQNSPWATTGCPGTNGQILEVKLTDNLFVFDIPSGQSQTGRGATFSVVQGCKDSCISSTGASSYSDYQLFQGNAYWSEVETFGGPSGVSDAFQVSQNQGSGGLIKGSNGTYSCSTSSMIPLSFSIAPDDWQGDGDSSKELVPMNEDVGGGATVNPTNSSNPNFPASGTSGNVPTDFTINSYTGLGGFNPNGANGTSGTNAAITGAGSNVAAPSSTCSTVTVTPPAVCPTYPTFVYGSGTLIF
jgi:hypothetical protein